MITFFDQKRGAELEQEVIEQRLLINSLIAKVDCLESTISNMHSIHANDVNNLRASIERLTYTTRLSEEDFRKSYVGMQSGIPIYSMDEMREQEPRPSAFSQFASLRVSDFINSGGMSGTRHNETIGDSLEATYATSARNTNADYYL